MNEKLQHIKDSLSDTLHRVKFRDVVFSAIAALGVTFGLSQLNAPRVALGTTGENTGNRIENPNIALIPEKTQYEIPSTLEETDGLLIANEVISTEDFNHRLQMVEALKLCLPEQAKPIAMTLYISGTLEGQDNTGSYIRVTNPGKKPTIVRFTDMDLTNGISDEMFLTTIKNFVDTVLKRTNYLMYVETGKIQQLKISESKTLSNNVYIYDCDCSSGNYLLATRTPLPKLTSTPEIGITPTVPVRVTDRPNNPTSTPRANPSKTPTPESTKVPPATPAPRATDEGPLP